MKAVTVKEIRQELLNLIPEELRDLCLRFSRFKKEIDLQFKQANKKGYYFIKKGLRRILLNTRKYIRFLHNKKTKIDLLIYYCSKLKKLSPSVQRNTALRNLYLRQIGAIREKLGFLHEDLQYNYGLERKALES